MTKERMMPKMFWREAVACAVHLLNKCPTKSILHKTLYEAWSGIKSSVAHP